MNYLILTVCMLIASLGHTVEEVLYKKHGDYKIFYSAFNSSFIDPQVAAANHIIRGKGKGLVNIAVMKTFGAGIPSTVSGQVLNIFQQSQTLTFVAVREQHAVYYLAPFEFDNEDFLTFKITVLADSDKGQTAPGYQFKFQKKMYRD